MKAEVTELLKGFLPPHEITYLEEEEHTLLGLTFKSAGVAVKLSNGLEVFGSSSSELESPLGYAAFECLERYALLQRPKEAVTDEKFKLSLSNGVALHSFRAAAEESALLELVERN